MDPGQRYVRGHHAEGDCVVPETGKIAVGGPVVGDQPGLRGDGAEHESTEFRFGKTLDHLQPGAPGLAAVNFDRAGDQLLPTPLRPWVALAIGLAAIGHFLWEAAQLPLYTLWRTGTPREIAFALIHCTVGDILITTVTLTLAAAVALARHLRWPAFGWRMVFTAIVPGAAYTIFSEWLNVEIRRSWSYTAAMPVVPFLGTGL